MKRLLEKFVRPDAADAIVEGGPIETGRIESGHLEFIFAFVRAENPERLAERVGIVAEAGSEYGALVDGMIGPMVVMVFGMLMGMRYPPSPRTSLVSHLQQRFGSEIKMVHGAADGHFGNFGGKTRMSYTFTFTRFDEALAILARLQFGDTEEMMS